MNGLCSSNTNNCVYTAHSSSQPRTQCWALWGYSGNFHHCCSMAECLEQIMTANQTGRDFRRQKHPFPACHLLPYFYKHGFLMLRMTHTKGWAKSLISGGFAKDCKKTRDFPGFCLGYTFATQIHNLSQRAPRISKEPQQGGSSLPTDPERDLRTRLHIPQKRDKSSVSVLLTTIFVLNWAVLCSCFTTHIHEYKQKISCGISAFHLQSKMKELIFQRFS